MRAGRGPDRPALTAIHYPHGVCEWSAGWVADDNDGMTNPGGRLFTSAYLALTASDLAYFTASGVLIGVTPFFVTGPLGSGKAGLGLALGAFSVTTVVLRPIVGRMVDRLGRRRFMLLGVGSFAVLVAAHLLVTQLWMLIVLRLMLGMAESLFFVAGFATLADLAPPGRTGEAVSWSSVALYLGIAIGPGIGQLLLDWHGFAAAWAGATLLVILAAAFVWQIPETGQRAPKDAQRAPLIHRAAIRPGLALFTGVAGTAGFLALVGLHATEIGFGAWSVVPLVYGGIVVGCRILFARVPDRLSPLRLGAGSLALCSVGLVVLAAIPNPAGLFTGAAILALGIAFLTPAIFAAIFGVVPADERGTAAGTATIFIDLGFGGGPLLLGVIAAAGGIPLAFAVAGAVTATGGALLTTAGDRPRIPNR
jgi:MFS family permease